MGWANRGILSALHLQLDSKQDMLKFLCPQIFNCLAKVVITGSSPLLGVECVPRPPAPLGPRGCIGMYSYSSPSSRALSSRSLVTIGRILGCGLLITNCIVAPPKKASHLNCIYPALELQMGITQSIQKGQNYSELAPLVR